MEVYRMAIEMHRIEESMLDNVYRLFQCIEYEPVGIEPFLTKSKHHGRTLVKCCCPPPKSTTRASRLVALVYNSNRKTPFCKEGGRSQPTEPTTDNQYVIIHTIPLVPYWDFTPIRMDKREIFVPIADIFRVGYSDYLFMIASIFQQEYLCRTSPASLYGWDRSPSSPLQTRFLSGLSYWGAVSSWKQNTW